MWVLEVKSMALNPTRSISGAACIICAVLMPVMLHRLWLPSRMLTSTSLSVAIYCLRVSCQGMCREVHWKEAGIDTAVLELSGGTHRLMQRQIGRHAFNVAALQCSLQTLQRFCAILAVH